MFHATTLSHLALTFLSSFVRRGLQCYYSSTQQPKVMFVFSSWERGEIIKIKWKRVVKVEIETKNVRLHVRHIGFLCYSFSPSSGKRNTRKKKSCCVQVHHKTWNLWKKCTERCTVRTFSLKWPAAMQIYSDTNMATVLLYRDAKMADLT